MPATIARITMDRIHGENVFLVRFYENVRDIVESKPIDVYECSDVIPDEDAMIYFEDKKIIEKIGREQMSDHAKESTHWYDRKGNPAYTVIGKNGIERPATLRDARKDGLVPSVTTILREAARPGLQNWLIDQTILACLTLPKIQGESEADYIKRLKEDSKAQALKAAETGTKIHAYIQKGFCGESLDEDGMRYYLSAQKCLLGAVGGIEWHCEQSFATPYFGGKCDLHSEGYVIDFKSTDKDLDKIQTWDEHDLQLAAYRAGLNLGEAKCGILYVHVKTAESKLIWIPEEKLQRGWNMFRNLLDYWYAKTGLGG